jgi:hypothetical protein
MVQFSATRCSCIAILWVSLVSFAAITLCFASQRIIPKVSVYFVIDSVRKLLDTPPYIPVSMPSPCRWIHWNLWKLTWILGHSQYRKIMLRRVNDVRERLNFCAVLLLQYEPDSSVRIATRYRLAIGWSGFDFRRGLGIFLLDPVSRPALAPTQHPIQWVSGALSLEVKRPGCEADHSTPSSAEVKEYWSYTATPQYVFMAWYFVKHRDTLPLT